MLGVMTRVIFLCLPYLHWAATRAVLCVPAAPPTPPPYPRAMDAKHFGRSQALISGRQHSALESVPRNWPEMSWSVSSMRLLIDMRRIMRGIIMVLQVPPQTLFATISDNFQRKKAHKFVLRPLGNVSFNFGLSFNVQTSGNFGFAKWTVPKLSESSSHRVIEASVENLNQVDNIPNQFKN